MAKLNTVPKLEPKRTITRNMSPTKSKKYKQTVSASAIFKNRSVKSKTHGQPTEKTPPLPHAKVSKHLTRDALERRAASKPKARASSTSPLARKSQAGEAKHQLDTNASTHPLSIKFNQSADTYRHSLLSQFTESQTTLEASALSQLHARHSLTIRTPISAQTLPYPEAYALISAPLKCPLGSAILRFQAQDANGKEVETFQTFEERMQGFMARVEEKEKLMQKLKRDWEIVVNEVYWVGAQVLGEEEMGLLMSGVGQGKGEESLFVAEDEDEMDIVELGLGEASGANNKGKGKGKVRFEDEEDDGVVEFKPTRSLLKYPLKPVAGIEDIWVKEMEKEVEGLGQEALEELTRLEKEGQKQWAVKQRKILDLLHE